MKNSLLFLLAVVVLCLTAWAGYRVVQWRQETIPDNTITKLKHDADSINRRIITHTDSLLALDSIAVDRLSSLARQDSGARRLRIEHLEWLYREAIKRDSLLRQRANPGGG